MIIWFIIFNETLRKEIEYNLNILLIISYYIFNAMMMI